MWDMGLGTNGGNFGPLSEDEYKELAMEADEEYVIPGDVVEIFDSFEDRGMEEDGVIEDVGDDGSEDVNMVLFGAGHVRIENR